MISPEVGRFCHVLPCFAICFAICFAASFQVTHVMPRVAIRQDASWWYSSSLEDASGLKFYQETLEQWLLNLCWLMIIGDSTTQYTGDYHHPRTGNPVFNQKRIKWNDRGSLNTAHLDHIRS